ncbi:MAG: hypothetical protein O3B03_06475 [Proteobacteria bacterium]|nr:hypothetical protein [Pseudomonadota bacterium]
MPFPLLAAEIVISGAFWRLFAPVTNQFITRLLHGHGFKKVAQCSFVGILEQRDR